MSLDAQLQTQVALEIAMAIGNSMQISKMAREALKTYLRKLNCPTGLIIKGDPRGPDMQIIAESPRRSLQYPTVAAAVDALQALGDDVLAQLVTGHNDGENFYVMPLPDYGHIVLCRSSGELAVPVLASLGKLNAKLAGACIACEQNAELAAAKQAAEAADTAKTLFLANMSHEIRTPMNGVLGLANLLLHSDLATRERNFVETICSSAESLLTIIDDVLQFSKIEHGQFSLQPEPTALPQLVTSVVDILKPVASEQGLPLSLSIGSTVPAAVLVDASRLRQILTNLITNAIKFTETGQIDVFLRCIDSGAEKDRVEIQVIDTGIGISPEQEALLFDPFHQVDSGYDRSRGGVGLGLAITGELVALMGGSIELESDVGVGSRFCVTLDLERCEIPADEDAHRGDQQIDLSGVHILVAEDDETNRLVIGGVLELLGADYSTASDGQEVLEAAGEHIDLILMDVQMPRMDGLTATRKLRGLGTAWAREVPVVALTAHVMDEHRDQCLEAGMNVFLSKPISLDALTRALARFFPGRISTKDPVTACPVQRMESEARQSAPQFDVRQLSELLGNNSKLVARVLDTFREETPRVLEELLAACGERDYEKAARLAHRLKGTTANMAAHEAAELLLELEVALKAGDETNIHTLNARIPAYLDAIINVRL